jgi:hypothetical protein
MLITVFPCCLIFLLGESVQMNLFGIVKKFRHVVQLIVVVHWAFFIVISVNIGG